MYTSKIDLNLNNTPGENDSWFVKTHLNFVAIGDSIIAGHPGNYTDAEDSDRSEVRNILSSFEHYIAQRFGWNYKNLGIGGQTSTQIAARIDDAISLDPDYVIVNGGINDISGGVITKATFLANWETILDACETANIICIACLITPWTAGTNTQMQARDDWNTDLRALVDTYNNAIWVDFDEFLGIYRVGGDSGNLWNIILAYLS